MSTLGLYSFLWSACLLYLHGLLSVAPPILF